MEADHPWLQKFIFDCDLALKPVHIDPKKFLFTGPSSNRISRKCILCNPDVIFVKYGTLHDRAIFRGDLGKIKIGQFCTFHEGCCIRPPAKVLNGVVEHLPMKIGNNVIVGANSLVESVVIGKNVYIGKNCVIGKCVIIKDCCIILDNTVIPADTVLAPFSLYGGIPGRLLCELPETIPQLLEQRAVAEHKAVRTKK